jgi:hypothetical protein
VNAAEGINGCPYKRDPEKLEYRVKRILNEPGNSLEIGSEDPRS